MIDIEVAGLIVTIDNRFNYTAERCADYVVKKKTTDNTGIVLNVTDEKLQKSIEYKLNFDGEKMGQEEAEFDAIHYDLYKQLHKFNAFWLHSVLIEKNGFGYAFTAAPGVGKSTHAKLWLKVFDDAVIVNGDNPIIRKSNDGIFYGYGTPFCGKEGFHKNYRVPIKTICFLERSNTNFIEEIKPMDGILRMLKENWCVDKTNAAAVMNLYIEFTKQVKFYKLNCNMELEAAVLAYDFMK